MAAFEVIALDTATPQLCAPGASDTYTFPRAVEMPLGTANGVLYLDGSKVVTSGSALTFNSSIFQAPFVLSFDANASVKADGNGVGGIRMYANSSGTTILETTTDSDLVFRRNSIEGMRLTSTGLGIGTASPVGKLDTRGTAYLGADANNALIVESTSSVVTIGAAGRTNFSTSALRFLTSDGTAALERMRIDSAGNMIIGTAALATTATDGFLYVPTCAGTPTGTPTAITGTAPIVVDTTNNKLYFYSSGQWRDAGP